MLVDDKDDYAPLTEHLTKILPALVEAVRIAGECEDVVQAGNSEEESDIDRMMMVGTVTCAVAALPTHKLALLMHLIQDIEDIGGTGVQ